eukprot:TRINITY_DN3439_c3_g1_i2.p1 TRINITY_DN3439_c3_g1~~TRINITY_DN3439_c3_g1_i2.p1  ORF type:complete len:1321 (-),score=143.42 TRINITY_DN3439_c3_g1_i2:288-3869(-)
MLQWINPGYTNLLCFKPATLSDCGVSKLEGESQSQPVAYHDFVYFAAKDIHQINRQEHFKYVLQENAIDVMELDAFSQLKVQDDVLYVAFVGGAMYALEVSRKPFERSNEPVLWETKPNVKISSRKNLKPFITKDYVYTFSEDNEILQLNRTNGHVSMIAVLRADQSFSSSPVVGGGLLFVGLADGTLQGINLRNLRVQIKNKFAGSILTEPVYYKDNLYFGGSDGLMYAVNVAQDTALINWRYRTYDAIRTAPVLHNGIVYIGSDDQFVYGVDAVTGRLKWSKQLSGPVVENVIINGTQLYCTTATGSLYSLNINDRGEDIFNKQVDVIVRNSGFRFFQQKNILSVVYEDALGVFLYATSEGFVGCVEYASLKNLWRKKVDTPMSEAQLQLYNSTHLIITTQAQVLVFEILEGGKLLWKVDVVAPQGPALVEEDSVIVVTTEGLFEFDLITGEQGWIRGDSFTIVAPSVISKGTIYILSRHGYVRSFHFRTGSSVSYYRMTGLSRVKPILSGDTMFVAGGGNVYALNTSDGVLSEIWYQTIGGTTLTDIVLGEEMLFVVSSEMVYAFRQKNGEIVWEQNVGDLIIDMAIITGLNGRSHRSLMVQTITYNAYVLDIKDGTISFVPDNQIISRFGFAQFYEVVRKLLYRKYVENLAEKDNTLTFILEDEMVFMDLRMLELSDSPMMELQGMEDVLAFLGIDQMLVEVQSIRLPTVPTSEGQPMLGYFPTSQPKKLENRSELAEEEPAKKKSGYTNVLIYSLVCGIITVLVLAALAVTWRTRMQVLNFCGGNKENTAISIQQELAGPSARSGSMHDSVKWVTASDMPVISKGTQAPKNVDLSIDFYRELDIRMEIGSGGFGNVMGGLYTPNNQNVQYEVAIKQLHSGFLGKTKEQVEKEFIKEIGLHAMLRHPNIVKCFGASQRPRAIVMEYCHAGSLQDYLYTFRNGYPLPLQEVLDIGLQIADGLAYLHPHIVHLDLKPQNILFDANLTLKLADFGLAKWKDESIHHTRSITGTVNYMAPEQFSEFAGISERADIWSLAMVLWECMCGQKPYEKREFAQQYTAIVIKRQRPKLPISCPTPISKLLSQCWLHEHYRRPSAVDIVQRIKQLQQEFTREQLENHSMKIREELGFNSEINFAARPMTQPLHTMKSLQFSSADEANMHTASKKSQESSSGFLKGVSSKYKGKSHRRQK